MLQANQLIKGNGLKTNSRGWEPSTMRDRYNWRKPSITEILIMWRSKHYSDF